jgi:tagatose 6-phosphate kinase
MIVTVTLNPLLERRYTYKKVEYAGVNRDGIISLQAGGKGINVSRQLNNLATHSLAFTFLGGSVGRQLRNLLKKEQIDFTFSNIQSETRDGVVIIDEENEKVTNLFGSNPEITPVEVEEFRAKLEKIIQNCEIVIFSGSSPCKAADSIIPFGIETANKFDKVSVCDTYGNHLSECINAGPTILHNNVEEIKKSLNIFLKTEEENLEFHKHLYSKGIKQIYITNADREFYASNFDYHFKVKPPTIKSIDSTGSGDSFTAGIIYGWYKDLTFEHTLKLAVSLGTLNASRYDVNHVSLQEADVLLPKVEHVPIGKKMKTLDVTPR